MSYRFLKNCLPLSRIGIAIDSWPCSTNLQLQTRHSKRRRLAIRLAVADWIIEPLSKTHDRSGFTSGKPLLDDFIRARASQYDKRRLGRTFVATAPNAPTVLGYYTVAASAVAFNHWPSEVSRKFPKHPVPMVLLARLAVDLSFRGRGLGEGLLLDAFQRVMDLTGVLGVYAVEVEALDDSAVAFYRKYGFTALMDDPLHLFLPTATIQKVLG